jgi:hypothetical protein
MTDQEAHEILHKALPKGSTISISHNSWSRSVVGSGPLVHSQSWDWHVVVTVPNEIDHVEAVYGPSLADAVAKALEVTRPLVEARPPMITVPSVGPAREQKRDAS